MKRPSLHDLLTRLGPVARPIILEHFIPNCCIATCAILRRVLKYYGYSSEPIPVSVIIHNARMIEALRRDEVPERGAPGRDEWFRRTGAYGVGIVPESAGVSFLKGYQGFGGHVVLRVRNLLIDASIAQASRPQWGISLPNFLVTEATPGFLRGEHISRDVNNCRLIYQRITDYSFRTSRDWRETDLFIEPVRDILQQLTNEVIHA